MSKIPIIAGSLFAGALMATSPALSQVYFEFGRERPGWRPPYERQIGISCAEGRRIVRRSGYRNVRTIDCGGRFYSYAVQRRGRELEVRVSARNGRIVSVDPV